MPLTYSNGTQRINEMKHNKQVNPPQEVIVVEGRDDTKRLIETYGKGVKTIETNGSAIEHETIELIKTAHERLGVIVLTDPDYQGERIRRIIEQAIPSVKHAYIKPEDANAFKIGKSLGVEHATNTTIMKALESVMTPNTTELNYIPVADLMQLKLIAHPEASQRRAYIAERNQLGHVNGKQLQKRLAMYQVTLEILSKQLKEGETNGGI